MRKTRSDKGTKREEETPVKQSPPQPRPVMEYAEIGVEKRDRDMQKIAHSM